MNKYLLGFIALIGFTSISSFSFGVPGPYANRNFKATPDAKEVCGNFYVKDDYSKPSLIYVNPCKGRYYDYGTIQSSFKPMIVTDPRTGKEKVIEIRDKDRMYFDNEIGKILFMNKIRVGLTRYVLIGVVVLFLLFRKLLSLSRESRE